MSYHFRPILAYFTVRGTTLSYFFGRVVPARFVEPTGIGDRPRTRKPVRQKWVEVSDVFLESAAGDGRDNTNAVTHGVCTAVDFCPGP